jgi:predicted Zn-dependent peptidase
MAAMALIYRHRTAHGLDVIGCYLPGLVAAAGVIVGAGSAREGDSRHGVSHVLERAAFQATQQRSCEELRCALEGNGLRVGSALNPEWIRYWVAGLADDLPGALPLLAECVFSPLLDAAGIAAAKARAQSVLHRRREQREVYVTDLARTGIYSGHPLANPTLGTAGSIDSITADEVRSFHLRHYSAQNIVLVAAGQFDWNWVVDFAEEHFASGADWRPDELATARLAAARMSDRRPGSHQTTAIALPGPAYRDSHFYTWAVITQVLGGGFTSRLFRRVRDEQAMTYAIPARLTAHSCGGEISICGTTAAGQACGFVAAVHQTVRELAVNGVTRGELAAAKTQMAGQLIMRGESSAARMHTVLTSAFFTGQARSPEEISAVIDHVTPGDVASVLAQWRDGAPMGLATVGPLSAEELSDALQPAA